MARFEPKTFTTIFRRLAARVVARTRLRDLEPGGGLHTVLSAVAREMDDLYFQMTNLMRIWDIDTASGLDLDDRAVDYNPDEITRRGASKAAVGLIFGRTGTSGLITIPAGSVVRVPNGGPEFVTTAAGSIPNASAVSGTIAAQALEAGTDGNVDAAAISQLDAIAGVETVTNPAAATGGQDEESDPQFRARIKAYARSLPRGTPQAIQYAVLGAALDDYGRVVSAQVVEGTGENLGVVWVYVDDGAGTIAITSTLGAPETVLASALGGEVRLFLDNKPLVPTATVEILRNAVLLTEGTHYTLNRANGQITFLSTYLATGLSPGDAITADDYSWYGGLVAEAQKIVDGDPADYTTYPGYRAAGVQAFVVPPTVFQQVIVCNLVIADGYDRDDVRDRVRSAILRYVNGLGINGDQIYSELVACAQSVPGVVDVSFDTPTGNVVVGDGELVRVTAANIDVN